MPDYQKGKIYFIECIITGERYVGSTCVPTVAHRLAKHVTCYKQYKKGKSCYVSSYDIIERGNYIIHLVENFPCNSKDELTKREGEVIKQMQDEFIVVNYRIPGQTKSEYYITNKTRIQQAQKKYRDANPELMSNYRVKKSTKYTCLCGAFTCIGHKARHERTKKHIKFIESQKENN